MSLVHTRAIIRFRKQESLTCSLHSPKPNSKVPEANILLSRPHTRALTDCDLNNKLSGAKTITTEHTEMHTQTSTPVKTNQDFTTPGSQADICLLGVPFMVAEVQLSGKKHMNRTLINPFKTGKTGFEEALGFGLKCHGRTFAKPS